MKLEEVHVGDVVERKLDFYWSDDLWEVASIGKKRVTVVKKGRGVSRNKCPTCGRYARTDAVVDPKNLRPVS